MNSTNATENQRLAEVILNLTGEPICSPKFTFSPEVCLSSTVIMSIVATVTVVGNLLLLLTIHLNYRLLFRTPSTILIANLGFSDLLVGLLVGFPVAVRDMYRYRQEEITDMIRVLIEVSEGLTMCVSGCTIIGLSVDRYIAVSDPMAYRSRVTRRRVKIFILLVWMFAVLLCCLPLTGLDKKIYVTIFLHTHATIPIFLLTAVCIKMFQALKRHRREMETLENSSLQRRREMERERKMAHTIYIILTLFYLTLLPAYITLHLLFLYQGSDFKLRSVFRQVDFISTRFLFLNSAIDPYVYAWRIPKYRRGFMKIVSFMKHQTKTEITSKRNELAAKRKDEKHVNLKKRSEKTYSESIQDTYL